MTKMITEDLFAKFKEVAAEYKEKKAKLDAEERELQAELYVLEEEMTANLLEEDSAGTSERIYLKIRSKELTGKIGIIRELLAELNQSRKDLKIHYMPLYRDSLPKMYGYSATKIAEKHRYLMLKEISDLAQEMHTQFREVSADVYDMYQDKDVMKEFPRLSHFDLDSQFQPSFGWYGNDVVSKKDVYQAAGGSKPTMPEHMKKEEFDKESEVQA